MNMCYATQSSKDSARIEGIIKTCIKFNAMLEETIKIVLEDYDVSEAYIIEKYNSFSMKMGSNSKLYDFEKIQE